MMVNLAQKEALKFEKRNNVKSDGNQIENSIVMEEDDR